MLMRTNIRHHSTKWSALAGVILSCSLICSVSSAQISIGQENAVITSDTIWTQASSPYIITRDVEVRAQATLTIEAGVEIRFSATDEAATNNPNGVEILVRGRLLAMGTNSDPILINGQDLAGPAENATGIIFTSGALGSELNHVTINGLANGVSLDGDMSLAISGLSINAHKVAFIRNTGGSDLILTQATLIGGDYAADLAPLSENVFMHFVNCHLEGHIRLRDDGQGSAGFGSELMLDQSTLIGSVMIAGNLQAGAMFKAMSSTISSGGVHIAGNLNTGASVMIEDSSLSPTGETAALNILGSILSDATVSLSQNILNGSIKLGPSPGLGGSGEGQYFFFEGPSTWAEASQSCTSMGGKLADASDSAEAQSIYNIAKLSSSGAAWIGGTLAAPDCGPGANFVDLDTQAECNSLRNQGYPAQSVTAGKSCACNLLCNQTEQIRTDCVIHNYQCVSSITYQGKLPTCDALATSGDHCFGDDVEWTWESGETLDQDAAHWGNAEVDGLTCLGDSPNLTEVLHIAVDTQDPTGGSGGELGLWRARNAGQAYGYVCEGRLEVVANQEVSRGTVSITDTTVNGSIVARVGSLNMSDSVITSKTIVALYRQGMIYNNQFQGSVNLSSRDQVEVSANHVNQVVQPNGTSAGGGLQIESDHAEVYGNVFMGGAHGVLTRGSARIANNVIVKMTQYGIRSLPDSESPSGLDNTIANNTLVENFVGISIEGTINAATSRVHNNNVIRGDGIGVERGNAAPIVPNNNNVFDYNNLYSGFSPDTNSISANPGFVADLPAANPIFRLDSGSPLIDLGRCDLAPNAPQRMGGLRVDIDGIPRPFDGDFDGTSGCDIGAYEFGPEEIFMYVDGILADATSFSTGHEVELTLWGRRDSNTFPVAPAVWTISEDVGQLNEETDQFRPSPTPNFYGDALHAQFGNLTTSLDVDLACGCVAPDQLNGSTGECNGVPECYFEDWTCPVRENYCQIAEVGSYNSPFTLAAEENLQIRAGARDIFGFVFKHDGPFTYELLNGGGSVTAGGLLTASSLAGTYVDSLRISTGNFTGTTDITVTPNQPTEIVVSRSTQSVSTTRTVLYSAVVKDAFNNIVTDADLTWSISAAGGSTIDPVTGRVTAGCAPGTYNNAITASFGSVSRSADLIVDQGGAIVTELNISPSSLSIPATTSENFSVNVTDACGFTRPASNPVFSTDGNAGSIDQTGIFTAGCNLGGFNGTIVVNAESLQVAANINVVGAPLRELSIQPNSAQVRMGSSQVFEAVGVDECGRLKVVEPLWTTPITNGSVSGAGLPSNGQRLTVGCSDNTTVVGGVSANYTDEFNRQFNALSTITVLAGEVATLTVPQPSVSLPAGSDQQLQANAADACGNPRQDAIRWSTSNGSIDASSGLLTAGCIRGLYPAAVFAQAGTQVGQIDLEVTDGVLDRIEINPSPVTIQAGAQRQLNAQLFDGCNNLIEQEPSWRGTEGGSVTPTGLLTASQDARTYFGAIVAELGGVQTTADLVIMPAAASILEVTPDPFVVAAGSTTSVEVTAFDEFGNPFTPEVNWTVSPNAGSINDDGDFEAGSTVGSYTDGLIARVGVAELAVEVEITAGPVAHLNIQPTPVTVNANNSIQLTATPVDRFGNTVSNTSIIWSIEAGGGQINSNGLFSAFSTAGTFIDTIVVSGAGIEQRVTAIVRPSAATRISLSPATVNLIPLEEQQIGLMVFDTNNNMIDPSNVVYAVATGEGLFTVSPTGLVRALQVSGSGSIQVNANGLSTQININVSPGPLTQIGVSRTVQNEQVEVQNVLTVTPGQVVELTAVALDAFENLIDVPLTWSTLAEGFGVTNAGVFTAGTIAGSYPNAIRVRHLGVDRLISVEIVAGDPVELHIEPSTIIISPGSSQQLQAYFTDSQGNISDVQAGLQWSRAPSYAFDVSSDGVINADCSVSPDFYEEGIFVSANLGSLELRGSAHVDVRSGEVSSVDISPVRAEVEVNDTFFFVANGLDACGFTTTDVPVYSITNGGGTISPEGQFQADTVAEIVTIQGSVGQFNAQSEVTITPGAPIRLTIIPDEVSIVVGQRQSFDLEASDEYGNVWSPANTVWQVRSDDGEHGDEQSPVQEGSSGTIDNQGNFRAKTLAEDYLREIKVTYSDSNGSDASVSAFADVYLVPGAPASVEITPANPEFIPNQIFSFNATVSDEYENQINNVEAIFDAPLAAAGLITDSGIFTATDRVGEYPNAIIARVSEGVFGQTSITVKNSAPARIEITPNSLRTTVDAVERFQAVVYDTEGVEIENAEVEWSLNPADVGQIITDSDGSGRLAVGMVPGRYFAGIVATITTTEGDVLQGTADLIIPRDFDEDGIDDTREVNAMLDPQDPNDAQLDPDADGLTNAQEVNVGLDINDADCDDDGLADGAEDGWDTDTDGDGLINALDPDSDSDGIIDGVEAGVERATLNDTASDYVGDADPVTTTNPLSADSDDDGIDDGDEDTNLNGRLDPGETPANSDLNIIACDASLEVTGCPEALICLESVCSENLPETQPEPDDGCDSQAGVKTPWLLLALLALIALRRREIA